MALQHVELPFIPIDIPIPGSDSETLLLALQPTKPGVFSVQILLAAEPVRSPQSIDTVAPVDLFLRYTDLSGIGQNINLAHVTKLPFSALAMRGKEEGFVATEKSPITLWVRFGFPNPWTTKIVHFKAFVGAVIQQQSL